MGKALDMEAIVSALDLRLRQYVPDVKVWTRRDYGPDQVREWPTVQILQLRETPDNGDGMTPTVWDLELEIVAHVCIPGDETGPDSLLNVMASQIEAALLLQDGEAQAFVGEDEIHTTLGGLVVWCRISGTRVRGRGEVTGHGFVVTPIAIRAFAQ